MSTGQFAIALFENHVISVVPVKWIFKDNGNLFCHWTSSRQRIMANEIPNPNWPVWPIVRIMARRDTLKLAEELSDSYSSEAATSDLQDKNNICKPSQVRVRRKNRRFPSDDESSNDEAEKEFSLALKKRKLPDPPVYKDDASHNDEILSSETQEGERDALVNSQAINAVLENDNEVASNAIATKNPKELTTNSTDNCLDGRNDKLQVVQRNASTPNDEHSTVDGDCASNSTRLMNNTPKSSGLLPQSQNADRLSGSSPNSVKGKGKRLHHKGNGQTHAGVTMQTEGCRISSMSTPINSARSYHRTSQGDFETSGEDSDPDDNSTRPSVPSLHSNKVVVSSEDYGSLSSRMTPSTKHKKTMQSVPTADILLRILQISEETRAITMENQRNIELLKCSGLGSATDGAASDNAVFQVIKKPIATIEEMEAFNTELDDRHKYKNVVVFLSNTTGTDLEDKTRNVLKRLMTDPLQMLFNYEGRGLKNKRSIKDFPRILSAVYDSVLKNWPSKEGKDPKRVRIALCECLKHAAQRQARCQARERKRAQSAPEFDLDEDILSDSV